jgi:hypothetical protein
MSRYIDIKGKRFGRLLAIAPTNNRTQNGGVIWECRCDCGRTKEVSAASLMKGETKTCRQCEKNSYYVVCEIDQLRKGSKAYFYIDIDDLDKVKKYKWHICNGYVVTNVEKDYFRLHQMILGFPKSGIDHIDRNPLNNRRNNLRLCNQQQNTANTGLFKHNSTGYKGVSWDKSRSKYMAKIKLNGRTVNLGRYACAEDAAIAYNNKAKEAFGKFARLNDIGDVEEFNVIKKGEKE